METHTILLTYPMQNFLYAIGPTAHRLLLYILSFFKIPSKISADIDLSRYLSMTGTSVRRLGNYITMIKGLQSRNNDSMISMFSRCHINYVQKSLEIELNESYIMEFINQFTIPITIPDTVLCLRKHSEYKDVLRIAIGISQKYNRRKRFPMEIKMPITIFLDGCNNQRWRSQTVPDLIVRFNALKDRRFIDGWYVLDGDNEPIHFNCSNERQNALRQRLMRSWTHFTGADIVFEVSPSSWRKQ